MSVEFTDEQDDPGPGEALRELAARCLTAEGFPAGTEMGVRLVGPEQMSGYHARFLGGEGPTDVLSLPVEELVPGQVPERRADGPPLNIGDVIICPAEVRARADRAGVGFQRQMALLLVHGTLHLLGYDHQEEGAAERMEARERELLAGFREAAR